MTTIIEALDDPALFGFAFPEASWAPWRSFLAALFGLPADDAAELCRLCTGRQDALAHGPYRESWLVCGRRSGKSRILALIATYLAAFPSWRSRLAAGETGVVMILATDTSQAAVLLGYCRGLINDNPMLRRLVTGEGATWIEFGSRKVALEVHASSYRSVRGRTLIACLADECAFWKSETSVNPAGEVIRAVRPALATLAPDSLLVGASSPYSRSGLLWNQYRRHYGQPGSKVLVWQASSREMNSSLPAELIADAIAEDPEAGASEYLAQFRTDIARFVDMDVVTAAVIPGRRELPRLPGTRYFAFTDPSGGSSDAFALGVAHREGDRAILDHLSEFRPPFSPETVVETFAGIIRSYGCSRVTSDRYGGVWVGESFARHGIVAEQSAAPKSDLYGALLPALNSGRCELLDHPRLVGQLAALERRTARSGKDSIDHSPGAHDDAANAAAGALTAVLARAVVPIRPQDFVVGAPSVAATMLLRHDPDWQSYWSN